MGNQAPLATFRGMPRYFFDLVENGQAVPDDEGLEMADLAEACSQASVGLLELLTHRAASMRDRPSPEPALGSKPLEVSILVRQDDGPLLRVAARFLVEELQ